MTINKYWIWKNVEGPDLKYYPDICLEVLWKIMKNQDSWHVDWGLKEGSPEHEAEW